MLIGKAAIITLIASTSIIYSDALAQAPGRVSKQPLSVVFLENARKAVIANNFRLGLAEVNKSLAYDSKNSFALYLRGRIYDDMDESEKAVADFEVAHKLCSENASPYDYHWASEAYLRLQKTARGVAVINEGLKRYPAVGIGSCMLYTRRALEESLAGNDAAAFEDYERAVKQSDQYQSPRLQRARLYIKHGQIDQAVADYSQVVNKCRQLKLQDGDLSEALRSRAQCYGRLGKKSLQNADVSALNEMANGFATDMFK